MSNNDIDSSIKSAFKTVTEGIESTVKVGNKLYFKYNIVGMLHTVFVYSVPVMLAIFCATYVAILMINTNGTTNAEHDAKLELLDQFERCVTNMPVIVEALTWHETKEQIIIAKGIRDHNLEICSGIYK